jgi:hypothetical protein
VIVALAEIACKRSRAELAPPQARSGSRPQGKAYSRDFRGPNWLDLRKAAAEYADREPAVLVVGGGQAGLSIAARLTQLDVDTLIVEREARIGDNWRKRYHALVLHNQVHVNHLPYMPFPPNWPAYIPKDKLPPGSRPMWRAWNSTIGRAANSGRCRWLGHRNIQHTVRYTELAPDRFKNFWRD